MSGEEVRNDKGYLYVLDGRARANHVADLLNANKQGHARHASRSRLMEQSDTAGILRRVVRPKAGGSFTARHAWPH